ncbi:hypothetical protein Tsubulata_047987 [Turnera subulata]|uniref:Subtilisin-like protease fibronectin type-III domain-containing protein n=1 Tax=Turnera subulata TaxID=218843 RepID=A0A9Q0JET2_9ROSI|nr:hypothetical protein Tsubulata_047987 [Turnera subulata]
MGHGTHTASTAAGNLVHGASLVGLASGTARGGAPSARIAVYKICWFDGCYDADILAAFDDAIADGVDIISLSIGGSEPANYFSDSIAIGTFHAMKNGILTSVSAGNSGPDPATITNFSPWFLSVAASTIDRKFVTKIKLGNGAFYEGVSINTIRLEHMYPVVYGGNVPNTKKGFNESQSRYCYQDSLDNKLVKGKIVLCDWVNGGEPEVEAGAVGAIMQDGFFKDFAINFPLPATHLNPSDGFEVSEYVNKTRKPTATIFKSIQRKDESAPSVVSFSSRGPHPITRDLLKPDIAAPGVDILAAWTQGGIASGSPGDRRVVPYNIISGTSMSCPHATGAAAYIKSFHPTWSPAAIKSALMTTAFPMSENANPEAEFAYGSGHINPVKAINPGLVYDAGEVDYVQFLCGQGYSNRQLRLITGDKKSCSKIGQQNVWNLNYPSFALSARWEKSVTRVFHRTVTNVGSASSTYKATVKDGKGLKIKVTPKVLSFDSIGQKKYFVVKVRARMGKTAISGALSWNDGVHRVRSPVIAYVSFF